MKIIKSVDELVKESHTLSSVRVGMYVGMAKCQVPESLQCHICCRTPYDLVQCSTCVFLGCRACMKQCNRCPQCRTIGKWYKSG